MSSTNISPFSEEVYRLTRQIPKGKVSTYKEIAKALGKPRACQAVGTALSKNPLPFRSSTVDIKKSISINLKPDSENGKIPCHRVIASDGSIGGFFGDKGSNSKNVQNKLKLLSEEGIKFNGHVLDGDNDYKNQIIFRDFK